MNKTTFRNLLGPILGVALILAGCQASPSGSTHETALIPVTGPFAMAAPAVTATAAAPAPVAPPVPVEAVPTAAALPPAVGVQDQEIKNGTVMIDKVISAVSGWLVIYADNNGGPGSAIGHTGVHAGESDGVLVNIAAGQATAVLYAVLQVDAGAVGAYEYPGPDAPVVNADGQWVGAGFQAFQPAAQNASASQSQPGPYIFRIPYGGNNLVTKSSAPNSGVILVSEKPALGKFLTDANGMTLYQFKQGAPNTSACTGGCLMFWRPALTAGEPKIDQAIDGQLGALQLADGTRQITYDGRPLYRYAVDAKPGDTFGQGLGGAWSVVDP